MTELHAMRPTTAGLISSADRAPPNGRGPTTSDRFGMRRNFCWTLFGNLFSGAAQVASLCLIAKLTSVQIVGQYALAIAIVTPVIAFCNLQLRSVQASDAEQIHPFETCFALRLTTNLVALLAILVVAWFNISPSLLPVILSLAVVRLTMALSDVAYGVMQQLERMDYIATSQLISSAAQLLTLAGCLSMTGSLRLACYAMAVAAVATLIGYDLRVLRHMRPLSTNDSTPPAGQRCAFRPRPTMSLGAIGRLAWYALPLGCVTGLISLSANLPRYFVGHYVDTASVGVLAAIVCPGMLLQQTILALGQVALPRFGQCFSRRDYAGFRRLLLQVAAINGGLGATGVIVSVLFGRPILELLYREEIAAHVPAFGWVMASFAVNALGALGGVLTATGRFRTQFAIAMFAGCTMVVTCVLLVPRYGLLGAAVALFVTAVFRLTVVAGCVAYVVRGMRLTAGIVDSRQRMAA